MRNRCEKEGIGKVVEISVLGTRNSPSAREEGVFISSANFLVCFPLVPLLVQHFQVFRRQIALCRPMGMTLNCNCPMALLL